MSAITPQSNVRLLKAPLEMDNNHQLNFASKTAQYNYFNGLSKLDVGDDFTYIRQTSTLRVAEHIDTIMQYNYLMYQNEAYSNKWFYAFIVDMEYLNDHCTAITIKLDVFQTWYFDLQFKRSFVEREHVNDDTFGLHTVPENLETGDYVCNKASMWEYSNRTYMTCVQVTTLPNNFNADEYTHKIYNKIVNGCWIIGVPYTDSGVTTLNKIIKWYDENGRGDAIMALFIAPKNILQWTEGINMPLGSGIGNVTVAFPIDSGYSTRMGGESFEKLTTLDGYTPKNKKCLTAPFNYLYVSNNGGETVTYNFEDFYYDPLQPTVTANGNPYFIVEGALTQGCIVRMHPVNYKKGSTNDISQLDYGINGLKYPLLSWTTDYYLNWKAQNMAYVNTNMALNTVGVATGLVSSVFNLGIGGTTAVGYAQQVADTLHQVKVAEMTPPQAKGAVGTGDLNFAISADRFVAKQMCIRSEYARIIDDYFSMYGYKVNVCKVPNINGRQNWNYVKTIDANIIGDVPEDDIGEIKSYFDRGITIWHNPNTFLDYSQNNNIV